MRCNGEIGGCENCLRLNFECSLSSSTWIREQQLREGTASGNGSGVFENQSRLERRRVARACCQCRRKKAKCTGDLPSCQRCSSRGVRCQYPDSLKPAASSSGAATAFVDQRPLEQAISPNGSTETGTRIWSHYLLPSPAATLQR